MSHFYDEKHKVRSAVIMREWYGQDDHATLVTGIIGKRDSVAFHNMSATPMNNRSEKPVLDEDAK